MQNIKMTMSRMQLNSKFVNNMLHEWGRFVTAVKLNRGLRDSNYDQLYAYLKQHEGNNARGAGAAGYRGAQNRVGYANPSQARQIKCYNYNGIAHIVRNCTQPKRSQNSEYLKDKMLLIQAQKNGVKLYEEQLLFIAADDCDAFDPDVDEAPTAQIMSMSNLSSANLVYDEAGPSYDSDVLSEVHDHDHYQDAICEHHEYVKDNVVQVVQSDVSVIPNDAYMMILNNMHEPPTQHAYVTTQSKVVNKSLTTKLATYKEQVELYERRARFELTEREQKIDEQLRIVITDRNIKEEKLKKELHSVKMQLASTINHKKSMVEEVTSLKKDFKQKKNQYLEKFLDMKALKEKVEDKLFKQDQSLQTVHMLCKPKPYYDEKRKATIGYKSPCCLARAKQVQPALYNGHELIRTNHVLAIVHNSEDTLEIAEITRKKINEKMKTPLWTQHKINIRPPDYYKENFLVTFTPQTQLTLEQIFWSKDVLKMKTKYLKEQAKAAKLVKDLTVYPPNTPVKLVPRTCKKRITPTGLTEGERDFKQTKECYLTEVIPFFKILKEHFEGIQKALTIEIKEMKAIFDELEAKIDQNAMNRKYDEIKQKNILIANDTLIANCLSKEVFYIATNSVLNVSIFSEMHDAHAIVQARSVATLCKIVKEAKVERPLDRSVASACLYTKHSQELLEYVIGTFPKDFNKQGKKQSTTPLNRKKQVTFVDQYEISNTNTQKRVVQQITQKTNVLVFPSTRVDSCTNASELKPRSNTKKTRISLAKSVNKKTVEDHSRTNTSHLQKPNRVDSSISSKRIVINSYSDSVCKTCNKCFILANHDMCMIKYWNSVNAPSSTKNVVVQIVLWYLDSGCSKHMTGDRSRLRNFIKRFIETVRFGNDHFGAIMRQFCDSDLEVAFKKHSSYVRDTNGVELIKGSRGFNLYTISVEDMMKSSPICLLSKASKTKSWLWHRRLNHLNFGTINDLSRKDLISSGLVPNLVPARPYVPPTNKDLQILFQPMFDEYLEPPRVDRPVSPAPAVPVPVNSAGTPLSFAIDQDAPLPSHSPSSSALQSPCFHQGGAAESTLMDEDPFAPIDKDPFINIFALEPTSAASSSGDASLANSNYVTQALNHLRKWTKGHLIDNVIGSLSRERN
nr:hypothetical protein [Tanacetum cinerariifolium]